MDEHKQARAWVLCRRKETIGCPLYFQSHTGCRASQQRVGEFVNILGAYSHILIVFCFEEFEVEYLQVRHLTYYMSLLRKSSIIIVNSLIHFEMFHPHYVCLTSFPHDLVRQLIALRLKNLNDKNAALSSDYQKIQHQLRHHENEYRNSPLYFKANQAQSEAMLKNSLEKLQLQHFEMFSQTEKNIHKTLQLRKSSMNSQMTKSETSSKQKITPYHFTKFRTSLNKFSLACSKQNDKLKWNKVRQDQVVLEVGRNAIRMREKRRNQQERKR